MSEITVSYFSDLNVKSRTRRVSFPHATWYALHEAILGQMTHGEHFACYRNPNGGVVALDRDGITARV